MGNAISGNHPQSEGDARVLQLLEQIRRDTAAVARAYPSVAAALKDFLRRRRSDEAYLGKILGSKSRASELLSGKRRPTLSDLRAFKAHLGIPADVLLDLAARQGDDATLAARLPTAELCRRGWLPQKFKKEPEQALQYLLKDAGGIPGGAWWRRTARHNDKSDPQALQAWLLCAYREAHRQAPPAARFNAARLRAALPDLLPALGTRPDAPVGVGATLADLGIRFLMWPHLKGTYLDGAAWFGDDGTPTVALTGRFDRLDNFWFTLFHELAHLALEHVTAGTPPVLEDLELSAGGNRQETEADTLARDSLVPPDLWAEFSQPTCTLSWLVSFAAAHRLPPAVLAGRARHESGNYRLFGAALGRGEVRKWFPPAFPRPGSAAQPKEGSWVTDKTDADAGA